MAIQTLPLPITKGVYRNADGEALSEFNFQLLDGYLNELGYHVKRPGVAPFADLLIGEGFPVMGMYWWPNKQYVLAISNGKCFKIEYTAGGVTVTDLAGTLLTSGITTTFTTDGTYAFFAAGGPILYTDGITGPTPIPDGDAPTTVTHVDWIDGYLLAINGTNKFFHSNLNDPTNWSALSYYSAVGNADNIVAMKVFEREIYLFGDVSLEVWENTGSIPSIFQRVQGSYKDVGCAAKYSPVFSEFGIFWLSNKRRFVKYSGGSIEPVSTPYDKEIEEMSSVSDCVGNLVKINGITFMLFLFSSEDRTLAFNTANNTWSEWRHYNTTTGEYERFLGNYHCHAEGWGMELVGSKDEAIVHAFSPTAYDDDGAPIRFSLQTGHVDHHSNSQKRCHELSMRVKRGTRELALTPVLMYRWRNDNKQTWSNWHEKSLGDIGESSIPVIMRNLGIYTTRQWEFVVTENVPFSFGSVLESVESLNAKIVLS